MEYVNQKLVEFNDYIRYRKVAIIGLGVSNKPLLGYFHKNKAKVTVFDNREIANIPKEIMDEITEYSMEFSLGKDYLNKLHNFDLIIRSPSCMPTIPEIMAEEERGAIVTTEIELLMKMCPCKIIGVTGSDGKTTTTTLISEIIKSAGYTCHLGGNIGKPLFTKLSEIKPEDIVVLELSSFQLMNMEVSPDIAVITNISPNHLNIHKDYEEYINAKKNIFKFQNKEGILVANYDNKETKDASIQARGRVIYFSSKKKLDNGYIVDGDTIKQCEDKLRKHLISVKDITIKGIHNYENICSAIAATESLVDKDIAVKVCKEFKGVEHRIEYVRELKGIKFYNDSKATNTKATQIALSSFKTPIIILLGGLERGHDFFELKDYMKYVKHIVALGECRNRVEDFAKELGISCTNVETMKEAVPAAYKVAKKGDTVLLSPASASWDQYKKFEDRGDEFKQLVNKLK